MADADRAAEIGVEVVYATPRQQLHASLRVPAGSTLGEALQRSSIPEKIHDADARSLRYGVFGRLRELEDILEDGDRVEIYRPLLADPKAVRRERAAQRRREKASGRR